MCMHAAIGVHVHMRVSYSAWISGVERAGLGALRADGATESRGQLRTPQYVTTTGDCRFVFVRMCVCVCVSQCH